MDGPQSFHLRKTEGIKEVLEERGIWMKKTNHQGGVKGLLIAIALLCIVLGYYFYLSNREPAGQEEEAVKLTAVQEALQRNLDVNYPPSPREVVKYFGQLTQCFYNEEYTQEELEELALQIQKLYDKELVENKTQDQYLQDLRWDIDNMKDQEIVVSSYSPASSTDVTYFSQDGFEWARMHCIFTLRKSTTLGRMDEVFLLRKDDEGHWKIYGWQQADDGKEGKTENEG